MSMTKAEEKIMKRKSHTMRRRVMKAPHDELTRLIVSAEERPGVREVMEVYQHYRTVEEAARPYSQLIGLRRIVSLSDGTSSSIERE